MSPETVQSTAAPPQRVGPYRLLEPLGQGGMGVVYRAQHVGTGARVALKTVRVPREGLVQSIRREIHTLARLRHPGIVRILDEGLHGGLPWYAMELLEGTTLRRAAALVRGRGSIVELEAHGQEPAEERAGDGASAWWTHTLEQAPAAGARPRVRPDAADPAGAALDHASLQWVLTLLRALCAPLAYLHGEGLVHRDLKPDNILLRGNRQWAVGSREAPDAAPPTAYCLLPTAYPVIVDFGMASQFAGELGREALEVGPAAAGTVVYMAPEQIRGELVDARADLYALGCILYELLCGRPPFADADPRRVLLQHLESAPVPPSQLAPGLSAELDALVLRLLAKSPRARLGHADALAEALGRLGVGVPAGLPAVRPRPYLYRSGFAGREEALEALMRPLERLADGAGGLLLVGGESGVGKTRLALELARRSRGQGIQVLSGECVAGAAGSAEPLAGARDGAGGAPLEALRRPLQALADRCRERGLAETERLLGPRGKLLALYEPSLRALPGQAAHPEPAELSPELARMRLWNSLTETFSALAADRPLLLILDDLHWADELTLAWLEDLLRHERLQDEALLLLGTYRSEEPGPGLERLLDSDSGAAEHLELGRLQEPAVAAIVGDMLALEPPPERFSRFLARQSEGNPFFVAEYLRAAVDEGLLWRGRSGTWQLGPAADSSVTQEADYERLGLPRSLRALVERRLEGLPQDAAELTAAAAVLGREMDLDLLERVAALRARALPDALDELLRRHVLDEPAPGRLRFAHDKLREVAYARIESARLRRLHRAASEALELASSRGAEVEPGLLARHWDLAGEPARARGLYREAARQAAGRHAHLEAESLYRRYLALVEAPTAESVEARRELGLQVLEPLGRHVEALAEYERAFEEASGLGERRLQIQALNQAALRCWRSGRLDEAWQRLEQARTFLDALEDPALEGQILHSFGRVALTQGRYAQALDFQHRALQCARAGTDGRHRIDVLHALGVIHQQLGRLDEARDLVEEGLQMARSLGHRTGEASLLHVLAFVHSDRGSWEEARDCFEVALAVYREIGDRRGETRALASLGGLRVAGILVAESRLLNEQSLRIAREVGDRFTECAALTQLAGVHLECGELELARRLYRDALALEREMKHRFYEAQTLLQLVRAERLGGGPEGLAAELEMLERCEALVHGLEVRVLHTLLLCFRGHAALARGQSARDWLERAAEGAAVLSVTPRSALSTALHALARAQEAFERGEHERLFRGELVEDLPEALRRALVEAGHLPRTQARLPEDREGEQRERSE